MSKEFDFKLTEDDVLILLEAIQELLIVVSTCKYKLEEKSVRLEKLSNLSRHLRGQLYDGKHNNGLPM